MASNYLFADSIVDPGSTGSVKCAAVVDSPSNPAFQAELRGSGTDRAAICAQQRIHRLTVGAGWVVVATVLGGAGVCLMRRGDSAT
ncbi:hypothetical protein [Gordonia spumicola]|uniref:hypothetical protein n=1 Tax=Gordonia spumicola TaxID=589161 RepID=UPI00137943C6|nr:hypothetical protein [Gordonia spumicola]